MEPSAVPLARGLPVIGNGFAMARDMGGFLMAQYRKLGPVFRIRLMNRRFTVLAGVDANRFLQRDGATFLRSFEPWTGLNDRFGAARSVLSTDGAEHAVFRRTLKRGYSRRYAEDRVSDLIDIARREIADWPRTTPLAVTSALQRIASDQVGTLTTGVSPRAYNEELADFVHALLSTIIIPRPTLRWSPRFRRASARMDELYRDVIARHSGERRNRDGDEPDLIDDLLDLHESDPQFFPEADLKVSALGPFIAALDTVANTCSFMLYELLRNPDIMAQARSEANALFADGTPAWRDVREMDVMHRAAIETMRMHPVAPLLIRTAANSFEFGGHRIPAGEAVMIATSIPHYLPEFFPDPERFDIDRYTPDRAEHRRPYVYVPFGLGAHRCLGNGFAEVQIAVTMATVLHDVELALHPVGYRLKSTQLPLPGPDKSFRVRVRPRNDGVCRSRGDDRSSH